MCVCVCVCVCVCAPPGFRADRVPPALDAVVIGSGVGGLSAAVLLAKAGKRVLVLEQHDQAGGCTHTFHNKGFEFDVGKYTVVTSYSVRARGQRGYQEGQRGV